MDLAISFSLGVGATLLGWYLVARCYRPSVAFSDAISRVASASEPSGVAYRVKFCNDGRRDIVDLRVTARLEVMGLNPRLPANPEIVDLPVSLDGAIPLSKKKGSGRFHLSRVSVSGVDAFRHSPFPPEIQRKAALGELTLDDVLDCGSAAELQLIVLAYDRFSGSREVFLSRAFKADDVCSGPFERSSLRLASQSTKRSIRGR